MEDKVGMSTFLNELEEIRETLRRVSGKIDKLSDKKQLEKLSALKVAS